MPPLKKYRNLEFNKLRNSGPAVIIPRAFFNVINLLERDISQFTWKIHRKLECVSLMATYVPAKSQDSPHSEGIPGPSMLWMRLNLSRASE